MKATRFALYVIAAYQAIALCTLQFVVPMWVGELAGAPTRFASNVVLFSAPFLGGFVLAHLFGALIDVTGRVKPYMLVALGGHLAGLAFLLVSRTPVAVLAASALAVSFTGTLNTTLKTYVTRIDEGAKGAGLSRLTMASQVGWITGGVVTVMWLPDLTARSTGAVVAIDVGITLVAIAIVVGVLPRLAHLVGETGHASEKHGLFAGIREDLAQVYAEPALMRACLAMVFLVAGNWVFLSTFALYVSGFLESPPSTVGRLNIIAGVVTLSVLPLVGWLSDRRSPGTAIRIGAIAYVSVYLVLVFFPTVVSVGIVFSIPAYTAVLIGLTSAAATIGGVKRRGGGIGVVDGLWAIAIAAGAALGGAVADFDIGRVPIVALLMCSVGLSLAWSAASRIDRRIKTGVRTRF